MDAANRALTPNRNFPPRHSLTLARPGHVKGLVPATAMALFPPKPWPNLYPYLPPKSRTIKRRSNDSSTRMTSMSVRDCAIAWNAGRKVLRAVCTRWRFTADMLWVSGGDGRVVRIPSQVSVLRFQCRGRSAQVSVLRFQSTVFSAQGCALRPRERTWFPCSAGSGRRRPRSRTA